MPHNVFGKKLNRDTGQRQALLKGLAGALFRSEAIETTEAKAVAARTLIENLITHARRGKLADIRQIEAVIIDKSLVQKLVHEIAPRIGNRPGGYLRLIKLGTRSGDNAPMVRMEIITDPVAAAPVTEPEAPKTTIKAKVKAKPKVSSSPAPAPKKRTSKKSAS